MAKKTSNVTELARRKEGVRAQYMRDFGLTEDEFMKIRELFLPNRVPLGLTDAEMNILLYLCTEPQVVRLRREQRAFVIVPSEWTGTNRDGTVRKVDRYRFKQGLAKFMERVANYRSVNNGTARV